MARREDQGFEDRRKTRVSAPPPPPANNRGDAVEWCAWGGMGGPGGVRVWGSGRGGGAELCGRLCTTQVAVRDEEGTIRTAPHHGAQANRPFVKGDLGVLDFGDSGI